MSQDTKARKRTLLLASVAFLGGTLMAPRPAHALISGAAIVAAITSLQSAMNSVISEAQKVINGTLGTMNTNLTSGFTQLSNYMKAQVGAQEQIADANNMVQARIARDVRNAHVMDEHAVNRQDCLNLQGGQAEVIAAHNAREVGAALDAAKDARAQAARNTPSWAGKGQASQANNQHHWSRYCMDAEAEAGLCTLATSGDSGADQAAGSLLTPQVYADSSAIDRANDFETTLIQPVAPPALRGNGLTSTSGLASLPERRGYNAAISLAHNIGDDVESWHAGTVTLTDNQKSEASREGVASSDTGSLYEATELEVNRKYSGTDWQADLQAMPSEKSVLVQIALLAAQRNWIDWQRFKLEQKRALVDATRLSLAARTRLKAVSPLPVPGTTLQ